MYQMSMYFYEIFYSHKNTLTFEIIDCKLPSSIVTLEIKCAIDPLTDIYSKV